MTETKHTRPVEITTGPSPAMDKDGGLTIHCRELTWLPLAPKIWVKIINLQPESGAYTVIIKAESGGVLPRHRHIQISEIFIIQGDGAHPQAGPFAQGDFVYEPEGATHDPLHFQVDTELLMICKGPSVFLADDDTELYMMDVAMLQQLARAAEK